MNEIRLGVKNVFDSMSNLIFDEKFDEVIKILQQVDVDGSNLKILIANLSVTNPCKNHKDIKEMRDNLIKKIEPRMIKEIGENRTKNILKGLI